jgi:hypothetical protein
MRIDCVTESPKTSAAMIALLCFFLTLFTSPFKSKSRLEAENAALRHQLIVLQRRVSGRVQLTNRDRLFLVMLYRWFPSVLKAIMIIRPDERMALSCVTRENGKADRTEYVFDPSPAA